MKLSDVMSHAGLAGYAELALLLFLAAFVAILIGVFRPSAAAEMKRMSPLPLEDGVPASPRKEGRS
jgi:cbb3-type cytochrome oxidase subunit 3